MDYTKKVFSLLFVCSALFPSGESHAMNKKKLTTKNSQAVTKNLHHAFTPVETLALKRKSQLTAALQLFKERTKINLLPVPQSPAPVIAPSGKPSPTEAYMLRFKNEMQTKWGSHLQNHDDMIQKIIAREKEHSDTHYVFYHAHRSSMRLIHDVIQELYRFFFQDAQLSRFKFVRFWKDHSRFTTAHAFLDFYNKQAFSAEFDCDHNIAQQLLCVNLSLFGNRTYWGEGTFDFFLTNNSYIANWFEPYLENLFKRIGIDQKWAKPLMSLVQDLYAPDSTGQILQIFIPKNDVDKFVYASKAYGIPHGPIAAAPANIAFDSTVKRHKSIVPILESYQKNPFEMDAITYDYMQARVVLNAQIFDPKSNVKTYRYCSISKDKLASYKKKLRDIIACALEEWCTTYAMLESLPKDLQGTRIDNLLSNA